MDEIWCNDERTPEQKAEDEQHEREETRKVGIIAGSIAAALVGFLAISGIFYWLRNMWHRYMTERVEARMRKQQEDRERADGIELREQQARVDQWKEVSTRVAEGQAPPAYTERRPPN